jgi:hypothetical protein
MGCRDVFALSMLICALCVGCGADDDSSASSAPRGDAVAGAAGAEITLRSDVQPITRVEDAQPGVFIPPYLDCRAPLAGETGSAQDGQVCTAVAISGCTEPGKYFPDYASCEIVRTQRPFWLEPPAAEPQADDPRLNDPAFMTELAWMTEQVEASACTCCHDSRQNDGKTGQWDITHGPIWLDTLSDGGLALFIGYADSSSLGAYPSADNHGFDRTQTGIPTTDTARMKAFLMKELERRGISEAQARMVPPFGGPIYTNRVTPPGSCSETGQGIDPELHVQFGGTARYVYVLEAGSGNPGVPPNLDRPEGTLWRLDALASAAPIASGVKYGTTPAGSFQSLPERDPAPALKVGTTYQLYVLKDVGLPVANCLFEFGAPVQAPASTPVANDSAAGSCTLPGGDADGFGATCKDGAASSDCTCKASYCALMPGQTQGTCTVTGCKENPSLCPAGFSCLDLSAFSPGLPSICTKG